MAGGDGGGIGPGAHCLGLQGLQGPGVVHLVGQDTLDIVLQIHNIDDGDVPAAAAVLESAIIAIALKPGDRLDAVIQSRLDAQAVPLSSVKLKDRFSRLGDHHCHSVAAGTYHRGIGEAQRSLG